jgi:DNA-binding SARP family transcriptional activator
MAQLSLSFLGAFEVSLAGQPVTAFETDKVRALLAYLAVEAERPHRREALAGLLWPEQPEAKARHSLSQALFSLRQAIADRRAMPPPFLIVTRQALQFNPTSDHEVDVTVFTGLLAAACEDHRHGQLAACDACLELLEGALTLYRGDFLAGFSVGDALPFEEWALVQRERLQRLAVETLGHLVNAREERGEYRAALPYAWCRVGLDPWQEDACHDLIRLLALSGEREAALAQYEAFRGRMAAELGMQPAVETRWLAVQIRAGKLGRGAGRKISPLYPPSNVPLPLPDPLVSPSRLRAQFEALRRANRGTGCPLYVFCPLHRTRA